MSLILANQIIAMYGLFHQNYVYERWQVYVTYLLVTWLCCSVVLFANRALPYINQFGLFFILAGVLITIIVCAAMPDKHASTGFVWRDWVNSTGYGSDGFVFLMGMLNGAYAVGTPDCVSHLAEEIPNPRVNIPKAIAAQMVTGLLTAFFYIIAIFYSINDLDALLNNPYTFPLAELYYQATGTRAGSMGLLIVIFLPTVCTLIGCYITSGRMLWTLARDDATPLSGWVGHISHKFKNPFNATIICGCICTVLGAIYVGSYYAFNAFVGSFVVLSTLSYLAAILPHYVTRKKNMAPGPFALKGALGYVLAAVSCSYIIVFVVIFCFPYAMPVDDVSMNYTCVTTGGFSIFIAVWWFWKRSRGYEGPKLLLGAEAETAEKQRRGSVGAAKS
jgi:amino acid transporter